MEKEKKTIKKEVEKEFVNVKIYRLSIERIDKYERRWYCDFVISDLIGNPMKEGMIRMPKKILKKEFLKACEKIIDKYLKN